MLRTFLSEEGRDLRDESVRGAGIAAVASVFRQGADLGEQRGGVPVIRGKRGLPFGKGDRAALIDKRADGVDIIPNADPKIMQLLADLWATGDTQKVTDGVLGAAFIWQEDLNKVEGLNKMVKEFLDLIQAKGMLEAVKTIL